MSGTVYRFFVTGGRRVGRETGTQLVSGSIRCLRGADDRQDALEALYREGAKVAKGIGRLSSTLPRAAPSLDYTPQDDTPSALLGW